MRDWNKESFVDFIKGEVSSEELYGDYIKDAKERSSLEIKIETLSDTIIRKIDEGIVADFDYSDESLEAMENIIDEAFKDADREPDSELIETLVMNLGAYLGLTIINSLGGEWRFRSDFIHSSVFFKSIEAECFPFHRVARRLLQGKSESLADFYMSLLEVLGVAD